MNIKVAVVTLLLGLGAIEAMAQPGWYRPFAEVSPYEVVRILRARGLVPVSRPARIGPNYVVQATDRNGHLKRVVVDAAYGGIVRVISLNRPPPPPATAGPGRAETRCVRTADVEARCARRRSAEGGRASAGDRGRAGAARGASGRTCRAAGERRGVPWGGVADPAARAGCRAAGGTRLAAGCSRSTEFTPSFRQASG